MITVSGKGSESDYAIMKQVQQLKIARPQMAIVPLHAGTDFSGLGADEKLYLVAHGNSGNGNIVDVKRAALAHWLTDPARGVPANFGGIVILSCYSGMVTKGNEPSLAAYLADALAGRAATGTTVTGANGYSFGTPEFRKSGLSSVLLMELVDFNFAVNVDNMRDVWLQRRPTHTGGVLKNVDLGKTIQEHLDAIQAKNNTTEEIANAYIADFAKDSKAIEEELALIIKKIPGNTVAERADHLVNQGTDPSVQAWNVAIDRQYALFGNLYLWASPADAFKVVTVP
jgi:hypothetical protein